MRVGWYKRIPPCKIDLSHKCKKRKQTADSDVLILILILIIFLGTSSYLPCVCVTVNVNENESRRAKPPLPSSYKPPVIKGDPVGESKVGGGDATGLSAGQDSPNKEHTNRQR